MFLGMVSFPFHFVLLFVCLHCIPKLPPAVLPARRAVTWAGKERGKVPPRRADLSASGGEVAIRGWLGESAVGDEAKVVMV